MYRCILLIIWGLLGSPKVLGQTCTQIGIGKSNVNRRLTGFKIADKAVVGLHECARECMFLAHCKSFNFGQDDKVCEVNHADSALVSVTDIQTVERYIHSDISAWPRTMVGSCANHICSGTQRCVPTKGNYVCMSTDCDKPPPSDFAVLQQGMVTLGAVRTYKPDCPPGMIGYGTGNITCGLDQKWSPLDIGCRELQNCSDVKLCNSSISDGEFWLSSEALGGHQVKVYCHGMSTSAPSEYIPVDPIHNYGFDAGPDSSKGQLTNYTKIRVNIETMQIDRGDTTFTHPPSSTYKYARGSGCNCAGGCQPWKGYFHISTIGTGLRFSNQVNWKASGFMDGISHFNRNEDSTEISARCGGYCGQCDPDAPLYLYHNENDVVDDGSATHPECE